MNSISSPLMSVSLEQEFLRASDPSAVFFGHLRDLARPAQVHARRSRPRDRAFRPLLLGYNGGANVGSDVRVAEMIRQLRALFAHVDFDPALTTLGATAEPAFASVRQLPINRYFPEFLPRALADRNAVIVCEGSMFTSTFSDELTGIFAAAIGCATAHGMPGIGYGATVGDMSARLSEFIVQACNGGYLLCRDERSAGSLQRLGLAATDGADPAWTFEPFGVDAHRLLSDSGWNGRDPIIAVCPVNPFWWPVQIDFAKARRVLREPALKEIHFRGVFFHNWSDERRKKYETYLASLAKCIDAWRMQGCFPVLVGMEKLDRRCVSDLNRALAAPIPMYVSGDYGMNAIGAILRASSLVVSSRFHATVIAMSGNVPAIGVSMDSRIEDLFSEQGMQECVVRCDASQLDEKLQSLAARLLGEYNEDARAKCAMLSAAQLRKLGAMGMSLMDHLAASADFLPARSLARQWDSHLPALSARQERLLADYT